MSKPKNVYNEKDYVLVKIDSFEGKIDKRTFIYKYDSTRKMKINYFFDGNILAKAFFHNNKLDGISEYYEEYGQLLAKDTFLDGVKVGSYFFKKMDTSIRLLKDGKLIAPDSNGNFKK